MKNWIGKLRALFIVSSMALLLAGCGRENLTALVPKGYGAESSMYIIVLTTIIMTLVFLTVMVVYIIVLVRFRKKKGRENYIPKQVEGSKTLETVWTVIPIILVIIMSVPTVYMTFDLADTSDAHEHININVTANQYWWHFDYEGEQIQTSQDLYIPVNTKVYVNLLSSDVLHSFWVPSITGKLDTNMENVNTMFIEAYEEGVFFGKCTELCGPSHSVMDFKVVVVSEEDYYQWVEDMKNFDPDSLELDAVAQEGKELYEAKSCMNCHAIGQPAEYIPNHVPIGPDLTAFGSRSRFAGILLPTKENLVDWLLDPESIKPDNKMTGMYPELTEDEANKIAEYLMQLKPSSITPETVGAQ